MNILVVDDNRDNIYQLQLLLSANGFEVISAVHGAEALEKARQDPPDLIVSDILMPVMDGFMLCRHWMQDSRLKTIPFIIYTATYTDEGDRDFALSLGARRFIVKPEEPEVLLRTILEVIEQVALAPLAPALPTGDAPIESPPMEEPTYLREYNDVLVRKLESKLFQLESVRNELEQDIAVRRQVEKEVGQAAREWRRTFDAVNASIWVLDQDQRVLRSNKASERFFQRPNEDLIGKHCWEIVHGAAQPIPECPVARARKSLSRESQNLKIGEKWFEIVVDPILDEAGQYTGAVHIVSDITKRRQSEAEQEKLQTQLTQAQKMESVGRLAGGVAHDFNNMLGVILGHTELALGEVNTESLLHTNLLQIQKAAQRSADLTRQLLAFARKQTIAPKALDLNVAIEGMLAILRRLIGEDIHVTWAPGSQLWWVMIDPAQVDQILANLLINAKDAISGVGTVTIKTENIVIDEAYCSLHAGCHLGNYVMLTVSDNGCGMDDVTRALIFEPFFTTKAVGCGTGLGLATVYGIIKQNNGFIDVYSEPGLGTTFKIHLPRLAGEADSALAGEVDQELAGGAETILLVEDETMILDIAKTLLEGLGYTVLPASTPSKAIRMAEEYGAKIDLLITDVVMPEMNGRDLTTQLLIHCPILKCLYISGYTSDVIAHHGVLDANVHFLQKPFTLKDLAFKTREALED